MRANAAFRQDDLAGVTSASVNTFEANTRPFFFIGFALIVINRILAQTAANLNVEFLAGLPLMPVALCILTIRFFGIMLGASIKRVALALVVLTLSFVSYAKCGQSYLPAACLIVCGVGEIDVRRVIKITSVFVLLLIVGLGLIQFVEWLLTGSLAGSTVRSDGKLRLSFFFVHPNTLAALVCMAYIGITATRKKLNASDAILALVTGVLVIIFTDSRTSTAILFVYLLLRILLQWREKSLNNKAVFAYAVLPLLFEAIALAVPLRLFSDAALSQLNVLFNGRPGYWILQFDQLGGFSLFGQAALYGNQLINGWLYPSVTIDCFYAASVLQLGAWSFLAFYLLYLRAGYQAVKEGDCFKFVALLACAMFGFTEIHMIDFAICLPMLLLGEGLFARARSCARGVTSHCSESAIRDDGIIPSASKAMIMK